MGFLTGAIITALASAGAALLFKSSAEEKERQAEEQRTTAHRPASREEGTQGYLWRHKDQDGDAYLRSLEGAGAPYHRRPE